MSEPINGEVRQYHHPWNCDHGFTTQATYCRGTNLLKYVCEKPFIELTPKPGRKYYYHDHLNDFGYGQNGTQNYEECKMCHLFEPTRTPKNCKYGSSEMYESTCSECGAVSRVITYYCMLKPNTEILENGQQCLGCDDFKRG